MDRGIYPTRAPDPTPTGATPSLPPGLNRKLLAQHGLAAPVVGMSRRRPGREHPHGPKLQRLSKAGAFYQHASAPRDSATQTSPARRDDGTDIHRALRVRPIRSPGLGCAITAIASATLPRLFDGSDFCRGSLTRCRFRYGRRHLLAQYFRVPPYRSPSISKSRFPLQTTGVYTRHQSGASTGPVRVDIPATARRGERLGPAACATTPPKSHRCAAAIFDGRDTSTDGIPSRDSYLRPTTRRRAQYGWEH